MYITEARVSQLYRPLHYRWAHSSYYRALRVIRFVGAHMLYPWFPILTQEIEAKTVLVSIYLFQKLLA